MVLTKVDLDESLEVFKKEFQVIFDESIIKVQQVITDRLLQENNRLKTEVALLKNTIQDLEKSHQENLQYQRNTNVIIKGISSEVPHAELEKVTLNLFNNVCLHKITERDIVACHRLSMKSNNVIVKFVNKKDAVALKDSYKSIAGLNYEASGLTQCRNLQVDEHLTIYMSNLAYKCRNLVREGHLYKTKCLRGKIKVLVNVSDTVWHPIAHADDISKLVPPRVEIP